MLKLLLGLLGLVEALYPDRFMRVLTRLSYDYEGEAPIPKPWVVTAARVEGVIILGAVVWTALKKDCRCGLVGEDTSTDTDSVDDTDDVPREGSVDRID